MPDSLHISSHWILTKIWGGYFIILWCWRRLLRVPWTARRWNQSILKEINTEYSLQGLMLKLKLQYFGHLMRRADPLEKTLMLGKIKGRRRRGRQRMRWLDGITDSWRTWRTCPSWRTGETWCATYSPWGHRQIWLSDWTTTFYYVCFSDEDYEAHGGICHLACVCSRAGICWNKSPLALLE